MKILGLIVEYNPFHNGHIYHIKKAKEMIHPDYTIAIMSSSFVQRGEPAIIDKWTRASIALEYGIDLVIELPFVYSCQSADYFAKGAIDLLNAIGVTDICFGSEDGHIETFITIAQAIVSHQQTYDFYVQKLMKEGYRYPDACNQALFHILGKQIKTPNDLLGLSYVKEIVSHYSHITPHCFKRTNNYHDTNLQHIASASAIRKAIFEHLDYHTALPHSDVYLHPYSFNDYFSYLKYLLLTTKADTLKQYHLVDEGLENRMLQVIHSSSSMNEFIEALLSKRYTKPRIQRMIIHTLMRNQKEDIQKAMHIDYLRILTMNYQGRLYLNQIKKTCPYHIITHIHEYDHPALDIELQATKLLSLLDQNSFSLIKKEYSFIPYLQKKNQL